MPKFELYYHKIPKINESFYSNVSVDNDNYHPYAIDKYQNYNPLYKELFHLDENTYNRITLNHRYQFVDPNNVYDRVNDSYLEKNIFIKFSPLLDPLRYMVGKYKNDNDKIAKLPTIQDDSNTVHKKFVDPNNVSYTDNFFCYLSSQLLNMHHFSNALDYYGSFLCIQNKYKLDISDDLDYLQGSEYFKNNLNNLFTITVTDNPFFNFGSRANKEPLKLCNTKHNFTCYSLPEINIEDLSNNDKTDIISDDLSIIYQNETINNNETNDSSDSDTDSDSIESLSSEDSKNTKSITLSDNGLSVSELDESKELSELDEDDDNWETDSDDLETNESSFCEVETFAYLKNFPVQAICIEKCDGTLDELFENEQMSSNEGICALFQVIMTLLCYQKSFHFTHNDLHTNNIMYSTTDKEFLYYHYNKQLYKVPTYGKIYKIIDFGRSIYKFNGRIYCSDSFGPEGDANSQYNCEPYFNEKKPRIEPNFSFDLCRLGSSLYDFIIDNDENEDDFNDLQKIVKLWCTDDNNKNILYKKNGEERYPDFKLYKMIARTVHHHTPEAQLKLPFFMQFEISKKNVDITHIIDIDKYPCYV